MCKNTFLHFKMGVRGTGMKEKNPFFLYKNARREKIKTWFYIATENFFWTPKKIYCYSGIYAIVIYLIHVLCIHKQFYFFDYNQVTLWWGSLFMGYALYASWVSADDKRIVSIWFFGLNTLLFIIGPMNFIIHGYRLEDGIILCMNLLVANILWPFGFVITLMIIGIIGTSLFFTPSNPDLTIWSVWIKNKLYMTLWCSAGTFTLLSFIRYKKEIYILQLKEQYIKELEDSQKCMEIKKIHFYKKKYHFITQKLFSKKDNILLDLDALFDKYKFYMNEKEIQTYFNIFKQTHDSKNLLPLIIDNINFPLLVKEVINIHRVLHLPNSLLISSEIPNITLHADSNQLRQFLLGGIQYVQSKNKNQIIQLSFGLTKLEYDCLAMLSSDYPIKEFSALAVCITNHREQISVIEESYKGNVGRSMLSVPNVTADLLKWNNERIIDAHYGYIYNNENDTEIILIYVVPLDVDQIHHQIIEHVIPIISSYKERYL